MSSSPEFVALETPELRTGTWTRLGDDAVLGDAVTEQVLAALAETTRTAARSQGYAVGWVEGQRAARVAATEEARTNAERNRGAEQQRDAEHRAAISALTTAAARLHDAVTEICADVEGRSAGLTADLTETIVGRVVTDVDAVRRALALAPDGPISRMLLHPGDLVGLDAEATSALAERGCVLIADPTLSRGDALLEYDESVLDLRFGTAVDRVREVLR